MLRVLFVGLLLTGCYNTSSMRTGRVLPAGHEEMVWFASLQHSPQPLARSREVPCEPAGDGMYVRPAGCGESSALPLLSRKGLPTPMLGLGINGGGADGWEGLARFFVGFPVGGQVELGVRRRLFDTGRWAAAANALISFGGSIGTLQASGRLGIDISVHSAFVDGYVSPQIAWWGLSAGTQSRTDISTGLAGGTIGVRWALPNGYAIYTEVGGFRALRSNAVMVVPAIGFSHPFGAPTPQ